MATATFKEHFREIKRGRPGHRFQDRYEQEKKSSRGRRNLGRIWRIALGSLAMMVGIILCVIPGPGVPFLLIGGGLLATESRVIARAMDWLEVRVRAAWRWVHGQWKRLPLWGKIIVGVVMVASGAASLYFFYWLMSS